MSPSPGDLKKIAEKQNIELAFMCVLCILYRGMRKQVSWPQTSNKKGVIVKNAKNTANRVRKLFSKWLSLPNYDTVDIVAATLLANRLPGKAVWLAIVGPPATGKTEIVQALEGCFNVHMLDGISPATFSSGYRSSKRSTKKHGLLEQMRDGKPHLVVIKDFSSVLQKRFDLRGEILAQLRSLYDGSYYQTYGNDVTVSWEGKMGMIVCSTGQYDKEVRSLATFGDRFLLFRPREGKRELVAERACRNVGNSEAMERDLQTAYRELDGIEIPQDGELKVNIEARRMIAELADFTTRARTQVSRDRTQAVDELPELEGSARVSAQLGQLAKGLMLYFGREKVTDHELGVLEGVAFSTIPSTRTKVLVGMDLRGKKSGVQIAKDLGLPAQTARRAIEDLKLLGIIKSANAHARSPIGGWEVVQEWKPYVSQMREWYKGGQEDV